MKAENLIALIEYGRAQGRREAVQRLRRAAIGYEMTGNEAAQTAVLEAAMAIEDTDR